MLILKTWLFADGRHLLPSPQMKDKDISFQTLKIDKLISKSARPCLEEVCVNGMFIHSAKSASGVIQQAFGASTQARDTLCCVLMLWGHSLAPAGLLAAAPVELNPCPGHQELLLEGWPLIVWQGWDAPRSQG